MTLDLSQYKTAKPSLDLNSYKVAPKPETPLLTNEQGGFGTALKDVATGFGKGLMSTARDTAAGLQNIGKNFLTGITGYAPSGIDSLDNSTQSGAEINEQLQNKSRAEQTGNVLSTVAQVAAPLSGGGLENLISEGKNLVSKGTEVVKNILGTPKNDLEIISDRIAPKPTVGQARLAETQGRLVKGQPATLLKGETPSQILPNDQNIKSTFTTKRLIPDAAKMDDPTLYSAMKDKVTEIATNLEPEMIKVPINQATIGKITDDWEALKAKQLSEADKLEEPNILKSQQQFEARLQASEAGTMNDLWNTAKEYDASVPDSVKKATSVSSDSLQNKKQIWLQNRAILRDAINDSANGLGQTSKQAFSDMRDLYEAQNGLLSKATVKTPLAPSKIRQVYDSKTGKIIRTATKFGVGEEFVRRSIFHQ